ncbi:transposase [Streptomyces mirabilis]|nr:transposase [Streptomyces mirabilis]
MGENQPAQRREAAARPVEAGVTTGSLARRLGVSPTTLRSWDRRYGWGPRSVPTDGTAAGRRRTWPCSRRCAG